MIEIGIAQRLSVVALITLLANAGGGCSKHGSTDEKAEHASAKGNMSLSSARDASEPHFSQHVLQDPLASEPGVGSPDSRVGYCDVQEVIENNCQLCHGTQRKYGAPMTLVSYRDLVAPSISDPSKKVFELVAARIHDTKRPMPPGGRTPLSEREAAVLDRWIGAGAPPDHAGICQKNVAPPNKADTLAGSASGAARDWPSDCEKHYKFVAHSDGAVDSKYVVPAGAEQHPQFFFAPPWTEPVQVLKFKPIVDNDKVLHHWIFRAEDHTFLAGWAPGNNGGQLPPDVGFYVPTRGLLRLDIHYNNVGGTTAERDQSGVEVCVVNTPEKMRTHTATVYGLHASATAPAHQTVHNSSTCTVQTSLSPLHVFSNTPHMHNLGVHAKLTLSRNGLQHVLHDAPFSFDDQQEYPLNPAVDIHTGDQLTTTCSYYNPTDQTVYEGYRSTDEMCISYIYYWPNGDFRCVADGANR